MDGVDCYKAEIRGRISYFVIHLSFCLMGIRVIAKADRAGLPGFQGGWRVRPRRHFDRG